MSDETMRLAGERALEIADRINCLKDERNFPAFLFDATEELEDLAKEIAALSTPSTRDEVWRVVDGCNSSLGVTRTVQWVDGAPDVGTPLYASPPVDLGGSVHTLTPDQLAAALEFEGDDTHGAWVIGDPEDEAQ